MTRKRAAPRVLLEGSLGKFKDGEWVEILQGGEWKLARIRFFIRDEPWIRWNDEGERFGMDPNTRARQGQDPNPPELKADDRAEIDPMRKR